MQPPAPQSRRRLRTAPLAVLLCVGVLAGAALVGDLLVPPAPPAPAQPVAQDAPTAGAWYCPATGDEDGGAVLSVAAAADRPSTVTIERYTDGEVIAADPVRISPGDQLDVPREGMAAASAHRVRWHGGPAVASWRLTGGDDEAGAACVPRPAPRWHLAGLDTAEGARSTLHLFNPFPVDAVAQVRFATPEGPVDLVRTESVLVEGGTARRLDLNEFQPEQPDLGVIVEVRAGRLIAQGEVALEPLGDRTGPRGRALVEAVPAAGPEWRFAFARADDSAASWLSVVNPSTREAAIELQASDPNPDGPAFTEYAVPPGTVRRIDLAEVSTEAEFAVGVVSVNEVPVVASRVTDIRTASGREGVAASAGGQPARHWTVAGGGAGPRQGRLSLHNPGGEPLTVALSTAGEPPEDWAEITLEPNERAIAAVHAVDPDRGGIAVRLRAGAPVLAELRMLDGRGSLNLWSALGVAEETWRGPTTRPPVQRRPDLARRPWSLETSRAPSSQS